MSDDPNLYDCALPEGTLLNIGCYRIKRKIGQGGFGITYLALQVGFIEDIGDGQTKFRRIKDPEEVVIKELFYQDFCQREGNTNIIRISHLDKKVEFERLVNKQVEEGRILRKLNHPNIVVNRKIFEENGTAYIVMDYIYGTDLEKVLDREKIISPERAVKYTTQVLNALQHIHEHKIMHLDIKPSNIFVRTRQRAEHDDGNVEFLPDDTAIVIDFGASLTYNENDRVNYKTSKLISGISNFAPIEQREIENLKDFDPSLDTFSLAGTFFYCITGAMPLSPSLRISRHSELRLPTTFQGNELISDYWDAICVKGLKINARDRFSSAEEFLKAIENQQLYSEKIADAEKAISTGKYNEALSVITEAANLLLPTKTTLRLTNECEELIEKAKLENQYALFWKNAIAFEEQMDFENALQQYLLANEAISGIQECNEKIIYCQKKIEEKRELQKKQKFESLLTDAESLLAENNLEEAGKIIDAALVIYPRDKQALSVQNQINEQIRENENIQTFVGLVNKAVKFQSDKKYDDALEFVRKALVLYPKDIFAREVLKKITEEKNKTAVLIEILKSGESDETVLLNTNDTDSREEKNSIEVGKKINDDQSANEQTVEFVKPGFIKEFKFQVLAAILGVIIIGMIIILNNSEKPDIRKSGNTNAAVDSSPKVSTPADTVLTMTQDSAFHLVSLAEKEVKSGVIPNLDTLSILIKQHPTYKMELVILFAKKAAKLGNIPESKPYRDAANKLYYTDTTRQALDGDLKKIISLKPR